MRQSVPSEIEEFAKILIERVRDAAIRSNDRIFEQEHVIARRWKEAAVNRSPEEFAKILIPDIVDSTIAHLLGAVDQEVLPLLFNAANGKLVDLTAETDGLSGLYGGEWCEKYTKERFTDDFADLDDFFSPPPDGDKN